MKGLVIGATLIASMGSVALPTVAHAQGRGQQCEESPRRSTGRSIMGGIGGALAGGLLGRSGAGRMISTMIPVGSMLTDAIMNMLDCREQRKAADATEELTQEATRSGSTPTVGQEVRWTSDTRRGVSGRSVITAVDPVTPPPPPRRGQQTAANTAGDGARRCMTVTDIVIVDGEETRAPKRMCRTPPETRWARAEA